MAMTAFASVVRGSRGVWFIDNVSALMAMVKGCSSVGSMDSMAKLAHLIGFSVGASAYYEYVQSKSNWADEISREGFKGPWAKKRGFATFKCSFPPILLDLPAWAVVRVFSFF